MAGRVGTSDGSSRGRGPVRWVRAGMLAAMMLMSASGDALAAGIELRTEAGLSMPAGTFVSAEDAGVRVTDAAGKSRIIGWDRVRTLGPEHATEFDRHRALGETLWRGRARVERGDFAGAEELLEPLEASIRSGSEQGLSGPSGAVLYECLMRCRLHRGATTGALFAMFAWRAATGVGMGADGREAFVGGRTSLGPVMDERMDVMTGLPPIWLNEPAVARAAGAEAEWARFAGGTTEGDPLAPWYRAAMLFECAATPEEVGAARAMVEGREAGASEGVRLVRDIVLARVGDEATRAGARAALERRLVAGEGVEVEPWVEAWCRAGIGRSLVHEPDAALRRRGVLHLLHVPARFGRTEPGLAAVAMAEAARTLAELGDPAGAWALKSELVARYPRRSAAGWGPIREIKAPAESVAGSGATEQEARP